MSAKKRKRDVPVLFWVSDAEMEAIQQKMAQFGTKNLSAYLRKMAVDGYVVQLDLPELKELVSLLRRSSNNLNQLTTLANMGKITIVYGDRLAEGYGRISAQLRGLLKTVNGAPTKAMNRFCGERRHPGMSELSADKAGSE